MNVADTLGNASSAAQTVAIGVAPAATASPSFTGTAVDGQTLTSDGGAFSGDGPLTETYQWQRSADGTTWTAIAGPSASSYTLTPTDVGQLVRVQVTAQGPYGQAQAASAQSAAVAAAPPVMTAAPGLSGSVVSGRALSVTTGSFTGVGPFTYTYQWQRSSGSSAWTDIPDASASSYTLAGADVGH